MATHVLARARHQAVGRFGLVATPGGFGTPAFGPDHAVVRVDAGCLVVERGSTTAAVLDVDGSTLRALAEAAGCDLSVPFEAGHDTPPLGDADEVLTVDAAAAVELGAWYALGWRVLGAVVGAGASRIQLWPEHFDAGCDVPVGPADGDGRCNLGASPGDDLHAAPYLYVGPWAPAPWPGDPAFWNEPFGASLSAPASVEAGVAFLRRGLAQLG